jgi:hypothetical protein
MKVKETTLKVIIFLMEKWSKLPVFVKLLSIVVYVIVLTILLS